MRTVFFLFVFLAGCGAQPAPEFFGAKRSDVTRNGRVYTVFQKENRVEIIRLGYATRGEHRGIREDMIELIPQVTGCTLVPASLQGDSGEMRGNIRC
jgi:hypothetical protein